MLRRGELLLASLILAACAAVPAAAPEGSTAASPSTSTPLPPSTTSTPTTSSTPVPPTTTIATYTSSSVHPLDAIVSDPPEAGPHPAVVLVHGGSWIAGSPDSLQGLADHLVANGFLVINTRYRLATFRTPSFPQALDDIACAVRHAAHHPESDGSVTLIGHSAGAHLAAVVALTGTAHGNGCDDTDPAGAVGFIGLAGPYDITRVGVLAAPFFGVRLSDDPDTWAQGNPIALVSPEAGISALLVHGDADAIVGIEFAESFAAALEEAGLPVDLEVVAGATHMAVTDPEIVGESVLGWLSSHGS